MSGPPPPTYATSRIGASGPSEAPSPAASVTAGSPPPQADTHARTSARESRMARSIDQSAFGGGSVMRVDGTPSTTLPSIVYVTVVPSQSRSPTAVAMNDLPSVDS